VSFVVDAFDFEGRQYPKDMLHLPSSWHQVRSLHHHPIRFTARSVAKRSPILWLVAIVLRSSAAAAALRWSLPTNWGWD